MDGFVNDMRMKMVLGDELIMMGTSKFNQKSDLRQDVDNTTTDVGNELNYLIFLEVPYILTFTRKICNFETWRLALLEV